MIKVYVSLHLISHNDIARFIYYNHIYLFFLKERLDYEQLETRISQFIQLQQCACIFRK